MTIDLNDTRMLLAALERSYPPSTLLRDTFFPKIQTFASEFVDIDYRKGDRRLAPFVTGDSSGKNVSRKGHETISYRPPIMLPRRSMTRDNITQRGFGEILYSSRTPAQRAMELMARDMAEMREMNTRRIEWMCAQLMLYGKFDAKGYSDDGETYLVNTVTYDWTQKETLTGSDTWDNPSADIYGDLKAVHQTIARNSGANPTVALFSYNVEEYILKNEWINKWLDIRDMFLAHIKPRIVSPGVRYIGNIAALDLQLYAYDGIYQDDDGTTKQYIPDDHVIVGITGRGTQLFGSITQMEDGDKYVTYEGRDVPKVWSDKGKDVKMLRVGSRCVPKPEFTDDWFTLKVK